MIPLPGEDEWDFGPVFDLIRSLSISGGDITHQKKDSSDTGSNPPGRTTCPPAPSVDDQSQTQLGDFGQIWQYLGQPLHLPAPTITTTSSSDLIDVWDGQTASEPRTIKVVRWQDDVDCANLADNDENNGFTDLSKLTKQQRKKARRKQRQAERANLVARPTNGVDLQSGSEDESVKDVQEEKSLDRSAVIYQILHGTAPPVGTGRLRSGKLFSDQDSKDAKTLPATAFSPVKQALQVLKPVGESALEIAAARKKSLMSMLNEKFIDDRQYLSNLSFTQSFYAAEGVHVFIDASNVR